MVRRRTAALRHSNSRFQELCDLFPQTVFETDATGHIIFLNRSGFEMLGLGIEPDVRERIFEPVFTTRGKDKGTGIGLFVVCQALADMGGAMRVESEAGKGSTFIVTLPAAPSSVPGTHPDATT